MFVIIEKVHIGQVQEETYRYND